MFSENMDELLCLASKYDPAFCPNNCGRSYKGTERKFNLKRHMIYACGVLPKFKCTICFRKFTYKTALKSHVICVHKQFM